MRSGRVRWRGPSWASTPMDGSRRERQRVLLGMTGVMMVTTILLVVIALYPSVSNLTVSVH